MKKWGVAAITGLCIFIAPHFASAATIADLQAEVQQLLALVASLESQIAARHTSLIGAGSCTTLTRDLTLGSSGPDVTAVQQWLIANNYVIPAGATGYFGVQTQTALTSFQLSRSITPAAGYLGPLTRTALNNNVCTTTATATATTTTTSGGGGGGGSHSGGGGGNNGGGSGTTDTTPPTVSITVPASGAIVSGTSVSLSASASDNVAVANVTFYVDGSSVGSDTSAPYSLSWDSTAVSDGTHSITAMATDSSNNTTTSSSVSVMVENTPLSISNISSGTPGLYAATTTWTTNQAATSKLVIGTTTAYGTTYTNASLVTSHSIAFSGLTANTLYHFVVVSTNAQGSTATSSDQTFTTGLPQNVVIFLVSTTTTSWQVPSDWNSASNTIEVIGAGGGGNTNEGIGGAGGGYSKIANASLTSGSFSAIHVGTGGAATGLAGGDTYLCNSTSNCASLTGTAVIVGAQGGQPGNPNNPTGSTGGAASAGVGTTKFSGGNGGSPEGTSQPAGGGGGGAAGPHGNGANGGATTGANNANWSGGGGGGGGGGTAGTAATSTAGKAADGGNNYLGTGRGTGAVNAANGGNGTSGTGGGGGGAGGNPTFAVDNAGSGGAGGAGTDWDASHGSGGGGGGSGDCEVGMTVGAGGAGGLYGAGGGGGCGTAGAGAQGIIVITYTQAATSSNSGSSAPVISGISSGVPSPSSVTIQWTTDQPSNSQVAYGVTASYGATTTDATLTTSHAVTLSGLTGGTTYHFKLYSTNTGSQTGTSTDQTFISGDDGSGGAGVAAVQFPTLLSGYSQRTPWEVPGVDYGVGVPIGTTLADPTVSLPGCASYNASTHQVAIGSNNCTINGYDFTKAGGIQIYNPSYSGTLVENSLFGASANAFTDNSLIDDRGSNTTVVHNTFADDLLENTPYVGSGSSGTITLEYNKFYDLSGDAIDFGGTNNTYTSIVKWNSFVKLGMTLGTHPDAVQFCGGTVDPASQESYNLVYQPSDVVVGGEEGIQVSVQCTNPSITGYLADHNTIIAATDGPAPDGVTMSNAVTISGDATNVKLVHNYIDALGAYYFFYPTGNVTNTCNSNISMTTFQGVNAGSAITGTFGSMMCVAGE